MIQSCEVQCGLRDDYEGADGSALYAVKVLHGCFTAQRASKSLRFGIDGMGSC